MTTQEKQKKAIEGFLDNQNCAQAVFGVYSAEAHIEQDTAMHIASGFGGGFGGLQKTCGAVTGAFMALGAVNSQRLAKGGNGKPTPALVKEFHKRFEAIHGCTDCLGLLQCDRNTEEGAMAFKDQNMKANICTQFVSDAIEMTDDLLKG